MPLLQRGLYQQAGLEAAHGHSQRRRPTQVPAVRRKDDEQRGVHRSQKQTYRAEAIGELRVLWKQDVLFRTEGAY